MTVGLAQESWSHSAGEALALLGKPDIALIDLRERSERERYGTIRLTARSLPEYRSRVKLVMSQSGSTAAVPAAPGDSPLLLQLQASCCAAANRRLGPFC